MRFNLQEEYIEACDQVNRLAQTLKERDTQIERLKVAALEYKALLTRAVDALEAIYYEWPVLGPPDALIDELREAAE
jgi:hypothetical protein